MLDSAAIRKDFPMLSQKMHGKPLIYFDTAATAHKPESVIVAETEFYRSQYGTVHRAVYEFAMQATEHYQLVRGLVCSLLNARKHEEIIFTRGTTDSINLVAASFGKAFVKPGDEVLVSEIEHHSNIVPWQLMCEERSANLKVIPVKNNGEIDLDAFQSLLNEKTKIVAIGHVANSIGTLNPVKTIIQMAHQAGAKVLVDGAQAIPQMPVDVQDLDADFYAFSGHKAYGPTGIGILYGKEALLEKMPPYQGGGDMIETVTFEKTTYNHLPLKFEAGTPMIAQVMGLGAAVEYLVKTGLDSIFQHEHRLLEQLLQRMQSIDGIRLIGAPKQRGALVSFVVDGTHPLDVGTLLSLEGVAVRTGHHCAQPTMKRFGVSATIRASFGCYNTAEEVESFIEILKKVLSRLR